MDKKIFVSYGGNDAALAARVISALQTTGADIVDYKGGTAGTVIPSWIWGELGTSHACVFCLSTSALDSDWVQEEIICGQFAQRTNALPMRNIYPIRFSELATDDIPVWLRNRMPTNVEDFTNNFEARLRRLVQTICRDLDLPQPIGIPATIIAYNQKDAQVALAAPGTWEAVHTMCEKLGQSCLAAATPTMLWERYGPTPLDFKPFGDDIRNQINAVLDHVNTDRARSGRPPVMIHWYDCDTLMNAAGHGADSLEMDAFNQWRRGPQLIIIDSIAAANPAVSVKINNILGISPKRILLWAPPYTRLTGSFVDYIGRSLSNALGMCGDFNTWKDERPQQISFDLSTLPGLRNWISSLFLSSTIDGPSQDATSRMQNVHSGPSRPLTMLGG